MRLSQDQKQTLQGAALVIGANLISRGLTKVAVGENDQGEELKKNYAKLAKPDWKIPTWLFGPAWLSINIAQAYGTNKLWH